MVRQRRIGGATALAASLGALALCTAASSPQAMPSRSGGALAPAPRAAPAPLPAGDGGGTAAPKPEAGPPAPALEATTALEATPAQVVPLPEENEDFAIEPPPERDPQPQEKDTPDVPSLRAMGGVEGASAGSAGRLAQTGVDARLLGAAGTFLIGLGLAMLAPTLPVRRL